MPIQCNGVLWISVKITNLRTQKSYKCPLKERGQLKKIQRDPDLFLKIELGVKKKKKITQ